MDHKSNVFYSADDESDFLPLETNRPVHKHSIIKKNVPYITTLNAEDRIDVKAFPSLYCGVDFTKQDALRQRILVAENKNIFVDDYYLAVWSPVFRSWFFNDVTKEREREVSLGAKRFHHFIEFLECIYPQQKQISEANVQLVLPLAFEFQVEGLLKKCNAFLKYANFSLLDKIVVADRFQLEGLMVFCLNQIRPPNQVDYSSSQYINLSDRTKVRVLEKAHSLGRIISDTIDEEYDTKLLTKFTQKSEIFCGTIKGKSERIFHCNPYYLAAWSTIIHEQVVSLNSSDLISTCTDEELVNFLLATHPPLTVVNDSNVAWTLRAACKLEALGLIRVCCDHLLSDHCKISTYEKLACLDRCYLHELLHASLQPIRQTEILLQLVLHPTYDTLSTKAKAAICDRMAQVQKFNEPIKPHSCLHCNERHECNIVKIWKCPNCLRTNGQTQPLTAIVGPSKSITATNVNQKRIQHTVDFMMNPKRSPPRSPTHPLSPTQTPVHTRNRSPSESFSSRSIAANFLRSSQSKPTKADQFLRDGHQRKQSHSQYNQQDNNYDYVPTKQSSSRRDYQLDRGHHSSRQNTHGSTDHMHRGYYDSSPRNINQQQQGSGTFPRSNQHHASHRSNAQKQYNDFDYDGRQQQQQQQHSSDFGFSQLLPGNLNQAAKKVGMSFFDSKK